MTTALFTTATKAVVFIDTSVNDWQYLRDNASHGTEVVLLDNASDQLAQMVAWAQSHNGYDAMHIISHGAEGMIKLGNLALDADTAYARAAELAMLGSALTADGDLLLYGCNIAAGTGRRFISIVAALTGADVAASDNLTGAGALGGDWVLAKTTGSITAPILSYEHYGHTLDTTGWSVTLYNRYNATTVQPNGATTTVGSGIEFDLPSIEIKVDIDPVTSTIRFIATGAAFTSSIIDDFSIVFSGPGVGTVDVNQSPISTSGTIDMQILKPTGTDKSLLVIFGAGGIDVGSVTYSFTSTDAAPGPAAPSVPVLSAASDTGISHSDGNTSITLPVITGTGIVGATVHLYDGATEIGTATVTAGGTWSVTPASALADGTHTLTATQVDGTGTSVASSGLALVIDSQISTPPPPRVAAGSDTGPSGSDGITSNTTPHITGTAESGSTVTLYDTNGTTVLGSGVAVGGTYDIVVNSALSAGTHTIKASAVDLAGNTSPTSFGTTVVIDTAAPTGIALSAASAAVASATAGATLATLSATDATGLTYSLVTGDSVNDAENSQFTVTGGLLKPNSSLTAGTYHLYVSAADAAGNHAEQALTFLVVGGPSVSSIVRAAGGSGTVEHTATSISYTVVFSAPVTGVDTSDFTLATTGSATGTIYSVMAVAPYRHIYTVTVNGISGEGTIGLNLNATGTGIEDSTPEAIAAGYTGQVLTLDHIAPVIPSTPEMTILTDTGRSHFDGITSNTRPTFTGTGEVGSAVTVYDASNGNVSIGSAIVDVSGNYSITPGAALTAGAHSLYVRANDAAFNLSAASTSFAIVIDTAAPTAILLPTSTVYTSAGVNAPVGTLATTDIGGAGAFLYQFASGAGDTGNNAFTLTSTGILTINDPNAVGVGTESVRIMVTDAAGNSYTQVLAINVTAAPPVSGGGTGSGSGSGTAPVTSTVDGVPVTTTATTMPSGSSGTMVTIPVVTTGQGAVDGSPNVADIPLVTANTTSMLMAQVPVGTGLTASAGTSKSAGNSLADLLMSIKAQTATHDAADQSYLTSHGTQFLNLLSQDVPLLVSTVVVKNVDTAATTPLTLTGTSSTTHHTALVIDTSQLATNSSIVLNSVDFAAVVGAVTITGNTAGQIITGDVASQHVIVTAGTASQVHAGGGSDVLQYGLATNLALSAAIDSTPQAALAANSTTAGSLTAATSVLLNGGTGADTASFVKAQSAYTIDQRDGYVLVTDKADATQQITVTNVETLQFTDGSVTVQSRAELTTIAGLYQTILGRQADIGGFNYWGASQATGTSLGSVAVSMMNSSEAIARGFGLNGDATHDVTTLYQALFGRAPDAGGLAYWTDAMAHGQTLVDVANGFAASQEMNGHKLATTSWDLAF